LCRAWAGHFSVLFLLALAGTAFGQIALPSVPVEAQPLSANADRVRQALAFLGAPLPGDAVKAIEASAQSRDSDQLQAILDREVLLLVTINPEARFKVQRGPAPARLQQAGFTPVLVKIINQSASTPELRIF